MINYIASTKIQDAITSASTGGELSTGGAETVTVEIIGTATTRTIKFQGKGLSGAWYDIKGINMTTGTVATSTTGKDELWQIPIGGLLAFRCNVTVISGGNLTIFAKVEG